jgi:hypothetical protein
VHVNDIAQHIRNTAVVLYFQPFETIRLERMATAFGWTVEEVEKEVVTLIQSGKIQGRVDSQNKVSTGEGVMVFLFIHSSFTTMNDTDSKSKEARSTCRIVCLRHEDSV